MSFELWLTFVFASTTLLLIPGPTVLLVMTYALTQGRKVALATVAGVALGDFVAMTASVAGLGALVLISALLFNLLKWAGAIYLVWLGISLLRAPVPQALGAEETEIDSRSVFRHAAMVTALNPKSIAFFIAFVPQFLNAEASLIPQFAVLISTFVGLAALNALAYALLADKMRLQIRKPSLRRWLNRVGGGALIGMGALTASFRQA